tara:strand:+ start:5907 stop:6224 length:318 start_codon:yes stop_codon:yes gene_type:complete
MSIKFSVVAVLSAFVLTACGDLLFSDSEDKTRDRGLFIANLGIDTGDLSKLTAGIWVDPQGCDHWIIDDGIEGYLSARLADDGKPVCSGTGIPNNVTGPYDAGKS